MKKKDAENLIIAVLILGMLALIWESLKSYASRLDKFIFPIKKFSNPYLYTFRWYIVGFLFLIGYSILSN